MAMADFNAPADHSSAVDYSAAATPAAAGEPRKRRSAQDWEEGFVKVRKTIGWYNHNGGLAGQIIYKELADIVNAVDPRETLKILKSMDEQKAEIRNPTAWLRSKMMRIGVELDPKVKKVISWFNKHGNLAEQIRYTEVREPLSHLAMPDQLRILKGLEGKEGQIKEPTRWIRAAAQRKVEKLWLPQDASSWQPKEGSWQEAPQGTWQAPSPGAWVADGAASGLPEKVQKTIGWYNRSGLLQQEIKADEVAGALSGLDVAQALKILKGLETKGPEIRNPSAWIVKAAQKVGQ